MVETFFTDRVASGPSSDHDLKTSCMITATFDGDRTSAGGA